MKRAEMDRPSYNSLKYLTRVQPHYIVKPDVIIDDFVKDCLDELCGCEIVDHFIGMSRSRYSLEGHYFNLWKYDRQITQRPTSIEYQTAVAIASNVFTVNPKVQSLSWDHLDQIPFIPSSGAGYGYVGKKGAPGNLAKAIGHAVFHLKTWEEERFKFPGWQKHRFTPDLAWTRTQLGSIDSPKIRNVWGSAFHNILIEGLTAVPLMNAYMYGDYPIATGMNIYKKLPNIIHSVLKCGDTKCWGVGLDFRSFDATLQPWLMEDAFNILKQNIDFLGYYERLSFDFSLQHFIKRPIVMPDGRMFLKSMGLPSGSYFTQLVGSVCNYIAQMYLQLRIYQKTFTTFVLGDDSLFGVPEDLGYPDLELYAKVLAELGLELHTLKSKIATRPDELDFLGHTTRGTKIFRDDAELIALSLFTEYPVAGPSDSFTRIKGLLLDSGMTSWPMLHLYRMAHAKIREDSILEKDTFDQPDQSWITSVVRPDVTPKHLNPVSAWLLT